ncbi:MAG: hypothetical protein FJ184_03545 [Gammaproteobacteria bacterium]|nr:hypothetical protein [Gammaproteobacteria bacterium]
MVPIFAIVFGIMIPIVWIYLDQQTKQKLIEARHKERLAALERGVDYQPEPLPLDALFGRSKSTNPKSSPTLLWGLILTFAGAAIAIGKADAEDGSVVVAVGIALLLYHFLTRVRKDQANKNEEDLPTS